MSIAREVPVVEDNETRGHIEPMNHELARRTEKWYVCSRCWGPLTLKEQAGGAVVECVFCKEETCGYVTRHWTERKRSADLSDYAEVKRMLKRIGVLPKENLTSDQRIALLGF